MEETVNENKLEEKRLKNQKLKEELSRLELEVQNAQKTYNEELVKRNETKRVYDAWKQSSFWRILQKINKLKKVSILLIKCLMGKQSWKTAFSRSWKKKKAANQIKKVKYQLYELGFTQRALAELEAMFTKTNHTELKKLAAWELALWYANQYSPTSSRKAIDFLFYCKQQEKSPDKLRRIAIIEAECYGILEDKDRAKQIIQAALKDQKHIDLYLALANIENSIEERIKWINKGLDLFNISNLLVKENDSLPPYDRLTAKNNTSTNEQVDSAKVTVIIPVYNGEEHISVAIQSMLSQTWTNVEIIVVDDCSSDNTASVVQQLAEKDKRIKLLKTEENGGAYVARNLALRHASGDFVTINDADDWSHPEKIEVQVKHLLNHPNVIANTSEQARATTDLTFFRRGKPGSYMFTNLSSLMFRREPVVEKLGYWDRVRFGADGEFKRRMKLVFGEDSIVDLKTGPYSFQRQSPSSLTGNSVFGYHGFFMGARKEYFDSYYDYHQKAKTYYYEYNPEKRYFPVPEPMWPTREKKENGQRHFDVILISEFRLLGGTNMSNVEEIKAQSKFGLKTGLIQMPRYDFQSRREINPNVRELVDGNQVQMIVYGEKVSCDTLIVRHPPVLQEWQKYIPDVEAKEVKVIINQPPKRDYSKNGTVLYDIKKCVHTIQKYFGKKGKWYPIGPLVRESLYKYHANELPFINLADEDWVNIIDVDEWKRAKRPRKGNAIKIGRHSRGQYVKWPAEKEQLLNIYPESEKYEIHVLGGAEVPKKVLGRIPENWRVLEFGEVHPKDFLSQLDVFVYYTHPDWIEAFGRVIFEAMAVGVPVIIPPVYKQLFGEAAIYAQPNEVEAKVVELMEDAEYYEQQVNRAHKYVEHHFGYSKHISRLKEHNLLKSFH
ncbi:glycosyltransferase [Alkalihalobacillus sp. LMS39]|uniref:glycosyltransferase n=1 Tax=Alkalihalobacillus sp. LMS39 TaxID=2924032 RepID=UPI001FB48F68|nr:glycosyltransferase [Alkalihalobacillus sp. LMS39]UOE93825.1 glycosyltransferase [Alkalihalobacillus sp. LMS39]